MKKTKDLLFYIVCILGILNAIDSLVHHVATWLTIVSLVLWIAALVLNVFVGRSGND